MEQRCRIVTARPTPETALLHTQDGSATWVPGPLGSHGNPYNAPLCPGPARRLPAHPAWRPWPGPEMLQPCS